MEKFLEYYDRYNVESYLMAVIGLAVLFIAMSIIRTIALKVIALRQKSTKSMLDKLILEKSTAFFSNIFLIFLAVYIVSTFYLKVPTQLEQWLRVGLVAYAVFKTASLVNSIVDYVGVSIKTKYEISKRKSDAANLSLIIKVVKIAIFILSFIVVLQNLGVDLSGLLAGLGFGGIFLAFALKSIVEDLFASLSIQLDRPFREGDKIKISDKDIGIVESIGLKTTRLKALSGEELIVSNKDLTTKPIQNLSRLSAKIETMTVSIEHEYSVKKIEKIKSLLTDVVSSSSKAELISVNVQDFKSNNVDFELVFKINSINAQTHKDVKEDVITKMLEQLAKQKITLA